MGSLKKPSKSAQPLPASNVLTFQPRRAPAAPRAATTAVAAAPAVAATSRALPSARGAGGRAGTSGAHLTPGGRGAAGGEGGCTEPKGAKKAKAPPPAAAARRSVAAGGSAKGGEADVDPPVGPTTHLRFGGLGGEGQDEAEAAAGTGAASARVPLTGAMAASLCVDRRKLVRSPAIAPEGVERGEGLPLSAV